ncbi:dihydrodipicolinate synthase family protein [Ginsengibacter hankyongi]|uniref:Dihydrodipicolinate synthase family protein n=1 Tax=Ginsengibacter hankyongi TaxID=2607284 RepID=A0A5J5IG70_9BACT|nr:dihydrodipicolinate synthase family protein [Ginsengibacter hankyongi]KAA9036101.1 dihydrodipicolinate synthase family protein [Ginsengibacter hankyongi]
MIVNWQGIYPALLTPFNANNSIDFDMFKKNLNAQLNAGIDGIVIGGSLGEASTLLNSEKLELLQISKQAMNRPVPIIINIAEQSTKCAIEAAQDAEKNGADGLMLLPPMRYKADGIETVTYFKSVVKATSLPIIIYNNPYDYKIEVTLSMFEELADVPSIQAVKESTRDVTNITRMKNLFGNRFKILCGVDTLAFEELALGADGWVGGLVDAFPAETVAIYQLMKTGNYDEALAIYRWFFPLLELDIHPKFVQYIKLAAAQNGLSSEYVRPPRLRLAGTEKELILKIINEGMSTRPKLPDYSHLIKLHNVEGV